MYRRISPDETKATLDALRRRINERFPASNLGRVCEELLSIAQATGARVERIARPYYGLRMIAAAIIVVSIGTLIYSVSQLNLSLAGLKFGEMMQATDASLNNIVFIGAALFFVVTFETRLKRTRVLQALNELRSIAHVIDMHQLTKDPERTMTRLPATDASLPVDLVGDELGKYLSYCGELLALVGKTAALHAEATDDSVVLDTVSEVETLTMGISREIWQKITLLHAGR